jgi:predicted metalloprotease with PDZ domain
MRRWLFLVAAFLLTAAASPKPAAFELIVNPRWNEAGAYTALDVTVRFDGEADGETEIVLPDEWGGQDKLYLAVRDLTLENGTLSETRAPHLRLARHAPGARLSLTYRIVEDAAGPPPKEAGGNDYRPMLRAKFFHVLGNTIVVRPARLDAKSPAVFNIGAMPAGATFASDLQHADMGRALDFNDIMESILVGGDFRIIDAGGGMRLAMRGAYTRSDESWRLGFERIARAVLGYWRAQSEPYLVTIVPVEGLPPGSISIGGTGRSDAFAFFASPGSADEMIDRVMTHEMIHSWIPRRIGAMPMEQEQLNYWLSEGFTDWATLRIMARTEGVSVSRVVDVFNEWLHDYESSSVRAAPNAEILAKFWSDNRVQQLPYRRGMLFAHYLDHRVRAATHGAKDFDDVLYWMQARAARSGPDMTAAKLLPQAMRAVARIDIRADLDRFIEKGEPIVLPPDIFPACGTVTEVKRQPFHRGFDIEATQKNNDVIAGVRVDGPAYRAGMRDGMVLLRRSGGEIGNPDLEIAYDVMDGQTPRTLRYMPRGEGEERFRRLALRANFSEEDAAACRRQFAGN